MKFTDKTHLIKFNATYTIATLNLHVSDIKKTKMVRTINIYHTNKVVGDLGELRNKWALWKKVRTFSLAPDQTDICVNLPICVNANNLLV
jgi:E3 ubiquitin-protein ligase UBR4